MPSTRIDDDKRTRLIHAAAALSHERGLSKVALADIAARADVPLGNVYYYFKTKDAITEAVLAQRSAELSQLREKWDRAGSPKERLKAFVQMTLERREVLARAGCPVGSLCAEFGKEEGPLGKKVSQPFEQLLVWMEAQFAAAGRKRDKKVLSIHLLSALQGVALLAHCFRDSELVSMEAKHLKAWIDEA